MTQRTRRAQNLKCGRYYKTIKNFKTINAESQDPIGSVRYLRGVDCATISAVVVMDWSQVSTDYTSSVLLTREEKNTSFDFIRPKWDLVSQVEGSVEHK